MRVCTLCHQKVPADLRVCPRDGAPTTDADGRDGPLVGSTVGDYVLKRLIGEGGMGQVFEGVQPLIGKRVAVKLLKREVADESGGAQRLLAEARAVNAIGHRGIIDIFGFGALPDGRQYVVMEYLSGQPLSRYLRDFAPLPVDDALKLLDEVLAAVGAAHDAGVIHRDLKPSNLFLVAQADGSHFVKVLDFGLAKQAAAPRGETAQTRASRVLGTPEYMAPEQARAEPVGPRSDLYALGCVLFEMLTGEPPFTGATPFEIINRHLNEPVRLPPSVPAGMGELVRWMMQKDAAQRPASAELVRVKLRRLRKTLEDHSTQLVHQVSSMTAPDVPPVPDRSSGEVTRTELAASVTDDAGRSSDTNLTPLGADETSEPKETRILPAPAAARRPPSVNGPLVGETTESNVSDVTALTGRRRGRVLAVVAVVCLALGGLASVLLRPRPPVAASAPADAVRARYERVRAAWAKARGGRTLEEQRRLDGVLARIGERVTAGASADASDGLDDFVASALDGREP